MEDQMKTGDVVTLSCGGQPMTVLALVDYQPDVPGARVAWWDSKSSMFGGREINMQINVFPRDALVVSEKASPRPSPTDGGENG
jgi:uncharacterized protein YodC (DUF2158 family)